MKRKRRKQLDITVREAAYWLVKGSDCFIIKDRFADMNVRYLDELLEIRICWLDQIDLLISFMPDYVLVSDSHGDDTAVSYNSPDLEQNMYDFLKTAIARSMRFRFRDFTCVAGVIGLVVALLWLCSILAGIKIHSWF